MAIRMVTISPRISPVRPISTRSRPAHRAFHFSPDDDFARIDIGRNLAVRADGYAAIGKMDGALHFPVDVQILPAPYFTFNQ